jgi:hypothetical protein
MSGVRLSPERAHRTMGYHPASTRATPTLRGRCASNHTVPTSDGLGRLAKALTLASRHRHQHPARVSSPPVQSTSPEPVPYRPTRPHRQLPCRCRYGGQEEVQISFHPHPRHPAPVPLSKAITSQTTRPPITWVRHHHIPPLLLHPSRPKASPL